jgi:phosphoribosylamine-glycine ligase
VKVLVVDSGGRGHSIAWQFKNDPYVKEVICAPGNAGIAREIRCENARRNGVDNIESPDCKIFFAGVSNSEEKGLVTDGGRVLHVVGRGKSLQAAREIAYKGIEKIKFEGIRCRTDIGKL